jgi:hypothetical protein
MRFFWAEKMLPRFFRLREIHKKQKKLIFLAPTSTNVVYDRNFSYVWIQIVLYNNSPQFRSNRRQQIFSEKTMYSPLLSNLHPEKTFKRP